MRRQGNISNCQPKSLSDQFCLRDRDVDEMRERSFPYFTGSRTRVFESVKNVDHSIVATDLNLPLILIHDASQNCYFDTRGQPACQC